MGLPARYLPQSTLHSSSRLIHDLLSHSIVLAIESGLVSSVPHGLVTCNSCTTPTPPFQASTCVVVCAAQPPTSDRAPLDRRAHSSLRPAITSTPALKPSHIRLLPRATTHEWRSPDVPFRNIPRRALRGGFYPEAQVVALRRRLDRWLLVPLCG
jgi:hypothetical protein